jgi:HAMP domain-containing protein
VSGPKQAQYKRRAIPIIDRQFQFKYTGMILAVAATVSVVLSTLLWRSYRETTDMLEIAMTSPEMSAIIGENDSKLVFGLTIVFLVLEVVVLGVLGLIITHRVAGPVFVVKRHLTTLTEGRFPAMRPLRDGDEFADMFGALQQLTDRLKQRDNDELAQLRTILAAVPEGQRVVVQGMIDERTARVSAPHA